MTKYLEKFGELVSKPPAGQQAKAAQPADQAAREVRSRGQKVWGLVFVGAVAVSALLVAIFGQPAVEYVLALIWGCYFGLTLLFFCPQKLLITFCGAILGTDVTDLTGIAPLIQRIASDIMQITYAINTAMGRAVVLHNLSVWLFLFCVLGCCVCAYFD